MPHAALPLTAADCVPRSHLFWPKVAYGPETQCWEWKAFRDRDGYGFFKVKIGGKGRNVRAHRVSYLLAGGELSPDQLLLHTCDNPSCVNPRHLVPGSNADNMRQKVDRGRMKPQHGEANPANKLTDDVVRQILAVLAQPDPPSQKEIGCRFGVSQMTISLLRQGKIWQHIERPPVLYAQAPLKGSAHARSNLTETDVRVIKMLLARPHPPSQESIGRAYGVPQSTISSIKRGRTWKHVPTPI
jgi:predicted XRE-type DNA-binding protein